MKTAAERSSVTVSRSTQPASKPFFMPVQTKLTVNKPGDKFEQEAESTADRVMRMEAPAGQVAEEQKEVAQKAEQPEEEVQKAENEEEVQKAENEEEVQKAEAEEEEVQRSATAAPAASDSVQTGIRNQQTGGQRLESGTRAFMESRFNADFSDVRVHSDSQAAGLSNRLGARAFTTGKHIFFARNQYSPGTSEGKHLLAHELAHTVQQGASIQRSPKVTTAAATPTVQRLGISDALDYFADKANFLPGFRMLTILLGFNPINMAAVDRSAGNILRALIELLPGGSLITAALENYGVFQKAGQWVEQQIAVLGDFGSSIRRSIDQFLDSLSWSDIFSLGEVWERAKAIFTNPINRLIGFAKGLVTTLFEFVREAILRPLAEYAQGTRGYDLLCALLGRDPITGDVVPRTAETLIGGFMKLIGREDIWQNIQQSNAIKRAWAWFEGALAGVILFVTTVPAQIMNTLRSLTWEEILTIVGVFQKISTLFFDIAGRFFSWALGTVIELLKIIFDVVAPGIMPFLLKAKTAFTSILENPIGFVGNLVRAGRLGFEMFAKNILTHLKTALINWIVGPLGEAGVYIPQSFSLKEIVKMVLSVLGLTWENIRTKLLKIIPEPVLVVLEKSAEILVTLATEGPAAAWEQIKAELNELKSMLIAEITEMVAVQVVQAAVTKIVSMINPAGAVVQAILAIYNTIMFFVNRMSQIAQTVAAFVNSIAAIAAGQINPAAKKVEATMAKSLTLVISFLARLAGLGGIPQKIVGLIEKIRKPIDKAMDKIVDWLGKMLSKMGSAIKSGVSSLLAWWKKSAPLGSGSETHTLMFEGEDSAAELVVKSEPMNALDFAKSRNADSSQMSAVKAQQKKIKQLQKEFEQIRLKEVRNQNDAKKVDAEAKEVDKELTKEFALLVQILEGLLDPASGEGSERRPIPIYYPKRRASAYENLYFGSPIPVDVPQKYLRLVVGMQPADARVELEKKRIKGLTATVLQNHWKDEVKVYTPTGRKKLPHGQEIGIQGGYADLQPGAVLHYKKQGSTEGGGKINDELRRYGYKPSAEKKDGDHVLEMQLGGPNDFPNLWPLPMGENRSSGSRIKSMKVEFGGKKNVPLGDVFEKRKSAGGVYLLVESVRSE